MKYALTKPDPAVVGALVYERWTWPVYDLDYGRQVAREVKLGGIWRLKTRGTTE